MATITTSSAPPGVVKSTNAIIAVAIRPADMLQVQIQDQMLLNQYTQCIDSINANVGKYLVIMDSALRMIQEGAGEVGWPADMPELPHELVRVHGTWLQNCCVVDKANVAFVHLTMQLRDLAQKAANDFELWYVHYALRYTVGMYNRCRKE